MKLYSPTASVSFMNICLYRYRTFAVSPLSRSSVTMTNHLSAGEHVRDVIGDCAQYLHALKLPRCHGMRDDSLRHVYKAAVLSKLLYASPAWWGFTSAADKRLEATVRRALRLGLYTADDLTPSQLATDIGHNFFCEHTEQSLSFFCTHYFQTTLNILTISDLGLGVTLCH